MKGYRINVCAVITDAGTGRVLVFRRADQVIGDNAWQFPQGGLKQGEAPRDGMLRELEEEIGTADVTVLQQAPEPIRYDYPADVIARRLAEKKSKKAAAKAKYIGQEQTWFLMRLNRGTEAINFEHQPAEFDAFRWVTPKDAVAQVVGFKTAAYRSGLQALGLLA